MSMSHGGDRGVVLAVLGDPEAPIYRIRWCDGSESFLRGEPETVETARRLTP